MITVKSNKLFIWSQIHDDCSCVILVIPWVKVVDITRVTIHEMHVEHSVVVMESLDLPDLSLTLKEGQGLLVTYDSARADQGWGRLAIGKSEFYIANAVTWFCFFTIYSTYRSLYSPSNTSYVGHSKYM